jgi:hypothetical protein
MKNFISAFFATVFILSGLSHAQAQCGTCVASQTGDVQFPAGSGPNVNIGGTMTILYDATNSSKMVRVGYNPHFYQTLYSGVWQTKIEVLVNGSNSISGLNIPALGSAATNPYVLPAAGGGMVFPFTNLVTGTNTIVIKATCISSGLTCELGRVTLIVAAPPAPATGIINVAPICCTVMSGPSHTSSYTGLVNFKMTGTVTNAKLKITSEGYDYYENFVNGGNTNCYKKPITISLVNNVTLASAVGSTVNGAPTYGYNPKFSCIKKILIDIKPDLVLAVFEPEGPFKSVGNSSSAITWTMDDLKVYRMSATLVNAKDGSILKITAPLKEENGKLFIAQQPQITKTLNGQSVKPKYVFDPKQSYVGTIEQVQ